MNTIALEPRAPGLSRTLVLLHGYGADEHDLLDLGHLLDPRLRVVSLQAPISLGGKQRAWYALSQDESGNLTSDPAEVRAGLAAAVGAVEEIGSQPLLLGFSQGGGMALGVLLTRPELVSGVLSLSGVAPMLEPAELAPKEALRAKPVFAAHGTQDPVVSIARGRLLKKIAEDAGLAVTWREYDMGHMVIPEELQDARAWLAQRL
jgi:phospholipase/carboxylesterase